LIQKAQDSFMAFTSRYSQHARRSLNQARLLAQDYQHDVIDTDHLLVGILREKGSLGCQVLSDLAVDARRAELEVRVLHGVIDPLVMPLDLSEPLRRVLVLATEESRWFGHHYVGTEHLLLALARSRAGAASELLHILEISSDQIRRRVRHLLNDGVTEINIEMAKRTARLSELSRRVLNAADQEGQHHAGLDHLLLVLARERRCMASRLLQEHGLDISKLEASLHQKTRNRVQQGAFLEDVIDHAVDRADQLGTHYTGTEHMLLALAQNEMGARLLARCGVDPAQLVKALYERLLPPG
jgi:ATP-dependent Clp protease ATP-binding subunit ClpA